MQLILNHIIPAFLEKEKIADSSIWDKKIAIKKGEKIQIIAASGRGKTSLVHFLYGLRTDYTGNIQFNDTVVDKLSSNALATMRMREMSIIFQDLRLFPDFTAAQNITVKRDLLPYHAPEKYSDMARSLGIYTKLPQVIKNCSYGEQQRAAIIRAMQQPFELLLMDEPFSNLDEANRRQAMQLIKEEVAARQATVILFDLKAIEYFEPDRILHL